MIKYSVVIPTKDREKLCQLLLHSIKKAIAHSRLKNIEIIIVNDSERRSEISTNGLASRIINTRPDCSGAGAARNLGAMRSSGKYLIFLDDDVTVPEVYFSELDRFIDEHDPDILGSEVLPEIEDAANIFFSLMHKFARDASILPTANLIVRRSIFDEMRFHERDDIHLAQDTKFFVDLAGKKVAIFYTNSIQIIHSKIDFTKLVKKMISYGKGLKALSLLDSDFFEKLCTLKIKILFEPDRYHIYIRSTNFITRLNLLFCAIVYISILGFYFPRCIRIAFSISGKKSYLSKFF